MGPDDRMGDRRIAIDFRLSGWKGPLAPSEVKHRVAPLEVLPHALRQGIPRRGGAGVLKNLLDIVPVGALQGKPVGIAAMGGSAHHYLAVDTQLRQVLGWFGALVAPTSVYLTGADFRGGALTSETARKDLVALAETLVMLSRCLDPSLLGPIPLAAKFT